VIFNFESFLLLYKGVFTPFFINFKIKKKLKVMKFKLSFLLFLVFVSGNSQSFLEAYESTRIISPSANANGTDSYAGFKGNSQDWNKITSAIGEFDNINFGELNIEGSIYLFDKFDNKGVIYLGNKKYITSNINLNINKNVFVSKIEGDSTFVYDILSIDKIVINSRQFKSFYNPTENKNIIFEVLFEDKSLLLLKEYYISFVKASPNPMVNRPNNKIKQEVNYFIYKNKTLHPFKLNKSNTLNLVTSTQKEELQKYIRSNDLSYKKETDINRILGYISKL